MTPSQLPTHTPITNILQLIKPHHLMHFQYNLQTPVSQTNFPPFHCSSPCTIGMWSSAPRRLHYSNTTPDVFCLVPSHDKAFSSSFGSCAGVIFTTPVPNSVFTSIASVAKSIFWCERDAGGTSHANGCIEDPPDVRWLWYLPSSLPTESLQQLLFHQIL